MASDYPLIQRIEKKGERAGQVKMIEAVLKGRFGEVPPSISAGLKQVPAEEAFFRLVVRAGDCPDLAAFEKALTAELSQPAPASTRGKRKPKKAE
jgi:hypothetical protein